MVEKLGAERQIFSTPLDRAVAEMAARQHGVVSRAQLVGAGVDDSGVKRRVRKGQFHRIHQGVYAVGHPALTREGRWMAAVLACGEGAVLSHLDAAGLWEIYKSKGARIHVIARSDRRVRGLWIHRARRLHPDDVTTKDGIPTTTPARTLVDLTDLLPEERVRRAVREAEYLQLLDHHTLNAAVQRANGRQRVKALRRALAMHYDGQVVRGELEHRFLELIGRAGLPTPETNVPIGTRRRTYTVDCLWRGHGVVVELDGCAAHGRRTAFEEDRARDTALNAIGLRTLRFTWQRVTHQPAEVLEELERTLAQSSTPSSRSIRRKIASDDAYVESSP